MALPPRPPSAKRPQSPLVVPADLYGTADLSPEPANREAGISSRSSLSGLVGVGPRVQKSFYRDRHLVFYYPSMEGVARELAARSSGNIVLGSIQWDEFPDGFPNIKVNNAYDIRWASVMFLASFSSPKVIFEQYSTMCSVSRMLARNMKIIVPYFPTGTMERIEEYGQIATAKTLARLLSSIPQSAGGPIQLCVCDIHTLANQFYFSDSILIRLESCIFILKLKMEENGMQNAIVAFPDEGAQKRFGRNFKDHDQILCSKKREGDTRRVVIKDGDPTGKQVVIVDDLVQSGGTLINCARLLRENGATEVFCYCTHAVFPRDESWQQFCDGGSEAGVVDKFWVCNTIPESIQRFAGRDPFEILSIAPVLERVCYDDDLIEVCE